MTVTVAGVAARMLSPTPFRRQRFRSISRAVALASAGSIALAACGGSKAAPILPPPSSVASAPSASPSAVGPMPVAGRIVGAIPAGYVYVDGLAVGDVGEESLKDRRILGGEGFVTCVVVVDSVTGKVAAGPEILARGFSEDAAAFEDVRPLIEEALAEAAREGVADAHQLQQLVRRVIGKWVSDVYRRRPMIIPVVVEV